MIDMCFVSLSETNLYLFILNKYNIQLIFVSYPVLCLPKDIRSLYSSYPIHSDRTQSTPVFSCFQAKSQSAKVQQPHSNKGRRFFPRILFGIFEKCNIIRITGSIQHKFFQCARPLRKPDDEIVFQPFVQQGRFFNLFHSRDAVVASADDADCMLSRKVFMETFQPGS